MARNWHRFFLAASLLALAACGGGSGGYAAPAKEDQKITVTISGQGTDVYGGADLTITLPEGFLLPVDSEGEPTPEGLTYPMTGDDFIAGLTYVPQTAEINGMITIKMSKGNGFPADAALVRMSALYPSGKSLPTADDFAVELSLSTIPDGRSEPVTAVITIETTKTP